MKSTAIALVSVAFALLPPGSLPRAHSATRELKTPSLIVKDRPETKKAQQKVLLRPDAKYLQGLLPFCHLRFFARTLPVALAGRFGAVSFTLQLEHSQQRLSFADPPTISFSQQYPIILQFEGDRLAGAIRQSYF